MRRWGVLGGRGEATEGRCERSNSVSRMTEAWIQPRFSSWLRARNGRGATLRSSLSSHCTTDASMCMNSDSGCSASGETILTESSPGRADARMSRYDRAPGLTARRWMRLCCSRPTLSTGAMNSWSSGRDHDGEGGALRLLRARALFLRANPRESREWPSMPTRRPPRHKFESHL